MILSTQQEDIGESGNTLPLQYSSQYSTQSSQSSGKQFFKIIFKGLRVKKHRPRTKWLAI